MIYFRQTGETFSDIYEAREAVLSFSEKVESGKREQAELIFDDGSYVLKKPMIRRRTLRLRIFRFLSYVRAEKRDSHHSKSCIPTASKKKENITLIALRRTKTENSRVFGISM